MHKSKYYNLIDRGDFVEVQLFDIVGFWEDATWLSFELRMAAGKPVHFLIHSEGGNYLDGIAMATILRSYEGKVTTEGIGLVASAATMLLLAGDEVTMAKGSFMMVHNPRTLFGGERKELLKDAALLEKMESDAAKLYTDAIESNSKLINDSREQTEQKVREWMDAETWFTAEEAVEAGLVQRVTAEREFVVSEDNAGRVEEFMNACNPERVPAMVMQLINSKKVDNMEKEKKGGILAQIKSLINSAEEPVVEEQEAQTATTPEEARAILEAAGFTVQEPESEEEETEPVEEEESNISLPEDMQALQAEIAAMRAELDKFKNPKPKGGKSTPKDATPPTGSKSEQMRLKMLNNASRLKAYEAFAQELNEQMRLGY